MSYLTQSDYDRAIKDHRLQQIIEQDLTILDDASDTAEAIIRDYLNSRYDVDDVFSKTGSNRHKQVVRWALMIALYIIYDRIEDALVPERIIKNYDDTLKHLERISDAKVEALLPRLQDADGDDITKFRWGSNTARSH